jgi:hypothetical protein
MVASSIAKLILGMRKHMKWDEIPLGSINKFGTGSKSTIDTSHPTSQNS